MKTVFVYDEDGFYCGTHIAQLNPRNKSSWLMPPHSTNVDPNDEDGFFFKIKDPGNPESGWDKIPYPSTAEDFLALNIPHESRTKRNNDLRRLLSQFAQNDPEHYREVSVNDESGKKIATKLEVIPEPTPEELKERAAAAVRSKRDYLLSKTDYLVSGDYPISAEDLVKVKAYKQSTVKRLLMRTREIFDMAVNAGFLNSNPLAKITKVFATPEVRHMPSIDWKELPIVISQIEAKAPPKYRALFYFSLATLLRPGEVVSIRIDWISEEAITIPAEFMKMKRTHRIPLTPYLISLINEAKSIRKNKRSPFLFPATNKNRHISGQAMAKWLHDQPEFKHKLVAHGLRSIGRSWFADNDVTFEVAEACLAHLVGSQVVRAYQRTDFFAPRQKVMLSWHAYIETCARCAQVLSQKPGASGSPK